MLYYESINYNFSEISKHRQKHCRSDDTTDEMKVAMMVGTTMARATERFLLLLLMMVMVMMIVPAHRGHCFKLSNIHLMHSTALYCTTASHR